MSSQQQPIVTREDFFAMYWDHLSIRIRKVFAALALLTDDALSRDWDQLEPFQREALRETLVQMLESHTSMRAKTRENRRKPTPVSQAASRDAA